MRYALINPSNHLVTEADDNFIDPTVRTKSGWRWVPIEYVINDTSTNANKITLPVVVEVQTGKVVKTTTIRNMTSQEVTAQQVVQTDGLTNELIGKLFLSVFRTLYGVAQRIVPGITVQQFAAFVTEESNATDITMDQFKTWVRSNF